MIMDGVLGVGIDGMVTFGIVLGHGTADMVGATITGVGITVITGITMHTTIADEEVFIIDLQYKMVEEILYLEEIQRQEELQVITLVGQVSEVTLLLQDRLVEQ